MSTGKNKSDRPGRTHGETMRPLHVYAPLESKPRTVRRASKPAAETSSIDARFSAVVVVSETVSRDRCTLYLSPEINAQLDLAAHVERKERSEIVEALLREHLPKYRIERN